MTATPQSLQPNRLSQSFPISPLAIDHAWLDDARRHVVGAVGWLLIGIGVTALVTPIPIEVPSLLAGAALLRETRPEVQEWVHDVIDRSRAAVSNIQQAVSERVRAIRLLVPFDQG